LEVLNGILYVFTFFIAGFSLKTVLLCLLFSALLALSLIDFKTYEIPVGFQYVIFVLAVCRTILDRANWSEHVIGFFAVSVVLYLMYVISKGAAIGGGDVKLMAVCGLFVGWKLIIFAFLLGCIVGSVVHIIRMKLSGESHVLAMGPYLSIGVFVAALWGNQILTWYLGILGITL